LRQRGPGPLRGLAPSWPPPHGFSGSAHDCRLAGRLSSDHDEAAESPDPEPLRYRVRLGALHRGRAVGAPASRATPIRASSRALSGRTLGQRDDARAWHTAQGPDHGRHSDHRPLHGGQQPDVESGHSRRGRARDDGCDAGGSDRFAVRQHREGGHQRGGARRRDRRRRRPGARCCAAAAGVRRRRAGGCLQGGSGCGLVTRARHHIRRDLGSVLRQGA
jgi:hypothetical protein